jgi:hypothetical protein
MRSSDHDLLDRWLAAEQAGRGDEAEAALTTLFAGLPPLQPPAGFADRVLLRAGLAVAPASVHQTPRSLFASFWVRGGITLCLFAVGVSVLWLPQTLRALAGLLSVGELVRLWTGSVVVACRWLGSFVGLWDFLLTVGRALATPLESPAVVAAMVSCLLVSMVAFRCLRHFIPQDRSWFHVQI